MHVSVHLSSNRSEKTSKYGKSISDTLGYGLVCHFIFLTTFRRLLLNRRIATWKFLDSCMVHAHHFLNITLVAS